jgi:hypothetical protein
MKRRPRSLVSVAFAATLALPLGSCSQAFGIEFSGFGPNIRLEFRERGFLRSTRQATCLKELSVYEQLGPTGKPERVWQINASEGCVTLTGIDVGHVPNGFAEATNRLPLKIGHRYQASARAEKEYPDSGISGRWFVCRRSPVDADWKNERELRELPLSCVR